MRRLLDRESLRELLGPVPSWSLGEVEVVETAQCDGFLRRRVSYDTPSGRASAFVCVPNGLEEPAALVYCHHQHNYQCHLGKSEVVGLRGDPSQAYAAELARRGFVTIAADSIGFEDRNWAGGQDVGWFELSSRLVLGRTLLADELQEISLAIDYGNSLPEVRAGTVGFIGHSFGGRVALWAPAWDSRIAASVSNCGCVSYRESFARDVGFQVDTVVPGFARDFDVEDLLELTPECAYLVIAGDDDRWSRGAEALEAELRRRRMDHARIVRRPGGHTFPAEDRGLAYAFLDDVLRQACTSKR
jgi:dienelactone hydrolase